MADSLWNLFLPHLNRAKEIQKPLVFGGVLSPISFAAERNGAAETAGTYGVRGRGRRSRRVEEVTRSRKRGPLPTIYHFLFYVPLLKIT